MRLFLAISPDEDCKARIGDYLSAWRGRLGAVRWTDVAQYHLTLAFLGEVGETACRVLETVVRPAVQSHRPFDVLLAGGGVFPDLARPRVIWIGAGPPDVLGGLAESVRSACDRVGFPADRAFRAHLTLGRVRRTLAGPERMELQRCLQGITGPYSFRVARVDLIASVPVPSGSQHVVTAVFPLGVA